MPGTDGTWENSPLRRQDHEGSLELAAAAIVSDRSASTNGGIAFVGDSTATPRRRCDTGKVLWQIRLGTSVQGFP